MKTRLQILLNCPAFKQDKHMLGFNTCPAAEGLPRLPHGMPVWLTQHAMTRSPALRALSIRRWKSTICRDSKLRLLPSHYMLTNLPADGPLLYITCLLAFNSAGRLAQTPYSRDGFA